jgi:hypothetical protein
MLGWINNLNGGASLLSEGENMSTQQGLRQASFRAIGGTTGTYDGDAMAAIATELEAAEIAVPPDYNGRLIAWLQLRLSSSDPGLNGLMQAFAEAHDAFNWASLGSFDPLP